jgi:L-rhamnose mutarotase
MKKICFRLHIRADRIDEYVKRHAEVWPEMLKALHATGWKNYSLFLDSDGTLIGYFETESLEKSLEGMAATEVNKLWQEEMAEFFELPKGQAPDTGFIQLKEIFNLEEQLKRVV